MSGASRLAAWHASCHAMDVVAPSLADAIAVLGCTVDADGRPSRALGRRIALAARLFHEEAAPRIIASGGRRWGEHAEAAVMRDGLRAEGVPEAVIDMELRSLSTAENCLYVARWLEQQGLRTVVVASCTWHLPRALAGFARLGVGAVPPPRPWCNTPKASLWLRGRERMWTWLDAGLMRRW